ncbi:MAG TPA: hypothetical protein ENJ95_18045 [Bacteroidetes bacterium]|nr:hypothetical protein [Bacteroidota bacterium]
MINNNNKSSFRTATNDFVKTVESAIKNQEIKKKGKDWLIRELDQMIAQLKNAKAENVAKAAGL